MAAAAPPTSAAAVRPGPALKAAILAYLSYEGSFAAQCDTASVARLKDALEAASAGSCLGAPFNPLTAEVLALLSANAADYASTCLALADGLEFDVVVAVRTGVSPEGVCGAAVAAAEALVAAEVPVPDPGGHRDIDLNGRLGAGPLVPLDAAAASLLVGSYTLVKPYMEAAIVPIAAALRVLLASKPTYTSAIDGALEASIKREYDCYPMDQWDIDLDPTFTFLVRPLLISEITAYTSADVGCRLFEYAYHRHPGHYYFMRRYEEQEHCEKKESPHEYSPERHLGSCSGRNKRLSSRPRGGKGCGAGRAPAQLGSERRVSSPLPARGRSSPARQFGARQQVRPEK